MSQVNLTPDGLKEEEAGSDGLGVLLPGGGGVLPPPPTPCPSPPRSSAREPGGEAGIRALGGALVLQTEARLCIS